MSLLSDPSYLVYRMRQDFSLAVSDNKEFVPLSDNNKLKEVKTNSFFTTLYIASSNLIPQDFIKAPNVANNPSPNNYKVAEYDPYALYKRDLFPRRTSSSKKQVYLAQLGRAMSRSETSLAADNTAPQAAAKPRKVDFSLALSSAKPDSDDDDGDDMSSIVSEPEGACDASNGEVSVVSEATHPVKAENSATLRKKPSKHKKLQQGQQSTLLGNKMHFEKQLGMLRGPQPANKASHLTDIIRATIGFVNPLADEFQCYSARGDLNALHLQILFPNNRAPLHVAVHKEALVQDAIGAILYQYVEERQQPELPANKLDVVFWNLRLLDDDGEIEEDFPALDRARKMQKFGFDSFALCPATVAEIAKNNIVRKQLLAVKQRSASNSASSGAGQNRVSIEKSKANQPDGAQAAADVIKQKIAGDEAGGVSAQSSYPESRETENSSSNHSGLGPGESSSASNAGPPVILRIHLYSTLEIKQTTMITAYANMKMEDVFQLICSKKKYSTKDYVLKMADTKTDVPLDKELGQLHATEFCVLKRGGGAGDIFLRPPEEANDEETNDSPAFGLQGGARDLGGAELALRYKQYSVVQKQLMGRHERLMTIENDTVYVMPAETKAFFDSAKSNSFNINSIVSCRQMRPSSPTFKLTVAKGSNFDTNPSTALAIASGTSSTSNLPLRSGGLAGMGTSSSGLASGTGAINANVHGGMANIGGVPSSGNVLSSTQTATSANTVAGTFIGTGIAGTNNIIPGNMSLTSTIATLSNVDTKSYDFEALSATEASDICSYVRHLMQKRDLKAK